MNFITSCRRCFLTSADLCPAILSFSVGREFSKFSVTDEVSDIMFNAAGMTSGLSQNVGPLHVFCLKDVSQVLWKELELAKLHQVKF